MGRKPVARQCSKMNILKSFIFLVIYVSAEKPYNSSAERKISVDLLSLISGKSPGYLQKLFEDYTPQIRDHSHKHKYKHKHAHQHSHDSQHTATHTHMADHSHTHAHVHRHKHNHIHDETEEHNHEHKEGHTHRHVQGYSARRRAYEKLAVDRTKDLLKTYMATKYSRMTGFGK